MDVSTVPWFTSCCSPSPCHAELPPRPWHGTQCGCVASPRASIAFGLFPPLPASSFRWQIRRKSSWLHHLKDIATIHLQPGFILLPHSEASNPLQTSSTQFNNGSERKHCKHKHPHRRRWPRRRNRRVYPFLFGFTIAIRFFSSDELTPTAAGAPSLAGAVSSASIVVHKQPPRTFKPAIKGRVGASVIATLIEAVAEIEATVCTRHLAQLHLLSPPPPSHVFQRLAHSLPQVLAPALDLLIKYFGNIVITCFHYKHRTARPRAVRILSRSKLISSCRAGRQSARAKISSHQEVIARGCFCRSSSYLSVSFLTFPQGPTSFSSSACLLSPELKRSHSVTPCAQLP
jgi:hypothetical protein